MCKARTHGAFFKSATGEYICEIRVKYEEEVADLMGLGFESLDDLEQAVSASTHMCSDCASDDEFVSSARNDSMPAQEPGDRSSGTNSSMVARLYSGMAAMRA